MAKTEQIMAAIDARFDDQIEFLDKLTRFPSTRGQEEGAQKFLAAELEQRGYQTDLWEVKVEDIAHLPGFSPVIGNYDNALNVVGTHKSKQNKGKSLILNGHIDVVPVGPLDMWDVAPFDPFCKDGWMYGRGVGDMKAGIVANLFALDALRACGVQPSADVHFQSVVEEECTGNGALACLQRGYTADAALIPEPFSEKLISAQIGVIWFQVHLKGIPVHVLEAGNGSNAIEASYPVIQALKELEKEWNAPECRNPHYHSCDHPLNLNIGKIEGGDWASSVPSWCCLDVRMAIFPGQDLKEAQKRIEDCIAKAARQDAFLTKNPPTVVYHGFLAEGYALADHKKDEATQAIGALETAHQTVTGKGLEQFAVTATTDARFFGLYADIPALVYGPHAEAIHGFNERVELESVKRVTKSIALFIANWCDLEPLEGASS
ncbi:ArgE/DapE family deacylase [Terasakiella pusilla]|uniref:ArgE/DapE family deacylase n=1 Tax=Terasakiella pusilla TaxID=64973 RepID=UPI003AA88257